MKLSTMVLDTNLATGMFPTSNFMGINKDLNFAVIVSLYSYLHALSHRQLYVTFSSRVKHGLDDLFYFIGFNKGLKFCYGHLSIPAWTIVSSRVEVGLDDLENLVTWVIFDRSNEKLNYIFECVPDF